MSDLVSPEIRQMAGDEALPRQNGELVFDAPWQGRTLGLAIGLVERLGLQWDAFRQHLIAAIAAEPERMYYESFAAALEAFALSEGVVAAAELDERASRSVER